MNQRIAKLSRFAVILLTLLAWFSISNHCAIGALIAAKTQSATARMHCHRNQPSPSKKSGEEMPCCKVLRATVAADSMAAAQANALAAAHDLILTDWVSLDDGHSQPLPEEIDTGPPFVSSFAELILQRSILAHAPPFFG